MWPSDKKSYFQLSHGFDGIPYFTVQSESDISLNTFPKSTLEVPVDSNTKHERFYVANESTDTLIANKFRPKIEMNKELLDDALLNVPKHIISECESDGIKWNSSYIYDPTEGRALEILNVQVHKSRERENVLLYCSGYTKDVFSIQLIQKKLQRFYVSDEQLLSEDAGLHFVPELGKSFSIKMRATVKQIAVSRNDNRSKLYENFVAVRTDQKIVLFHFIVSRNSKPLDVKVVGSINFKDLANLPFAHVSFSDVEDKIVAIDIEGNYKAWEFRVAKQDPLTKLFDTRNCANLEVLSNWKFIEWSIYSNVALFFDRHFIQLVNFETGNKRLLFQTIRENAILDYERCPDYANEGFILTSQELIWVHFEQKLDVIMSWKHLLNNEDASLKLKTDILHFGDQSYYSVTLFSQIHSTHFVYLFQIDRKTKHYKFMSGPHAISLSSISESLFLMSSEIAEGDIDTEFFKKHTDLVDMSVLTGDFSMLDKFFHFVRLTSTFEVETCIVSKDSKANLDRNPDFYIKAGDKDLFLDIEEKHKLLDIDQDDDEPFIYKNDGIKYYKSRFFKKLLGDENQKRVGMQAVDDSGLYVRSEKSDIEHVELNDYQTQLFKATIKACFDIKKDTTDVEDVRKLLLKQSLFYTETSDYDEALGVVQTNSLLEHFSKVGQAQDVLESINIEGTLSESNRKSKQVKEMLLGWSNHISPEHEGTEHINNSQVGTSRSLNSQDSMSISQPIPKKVHTLSLSSQTTQRRKKKKKKQGFI